MYMFTVHSVSCVGWYFCRPVGKAQTRLTKPMGIGDGITHTAYFAAKNITPASKVRVTIYRTS